MRWRGRGLIVLGLLALGAGVASCSTVGYLGQAAGGHLGVLRAARPVPEWLADASTPEPLRQRLLLSQEMRSFAVQALSLPDNDSYRRYADLHRPAAVWNVVAAPEFSLTLQTWCFPVVGCVGYRGYYDLASAQAAAEALKAPGVEVSVYPVPAYSTLGWGEWLGGDPLLNTFIQWPEGELARLIFHELAHQVAYAAGDTAFNESFATAVERLGGERWLQAHAGEVARTEYAALDGRRRDVRALIERTRATLEALYRQPLPPEAMRARKAEVMTAMRAEQQRLKAQAWGGFAGYDAYFDRLNNAMLGVQGAYFGWVPAFEALFRQQGSDFPRFYAEVRRLASLPREPREAALRALQPAEAGASPS